MQFSTCYRPQEGNWPMTVYESPTSFLGFYSCQLVLTLASAIHDNDFVQKFVADALEHYRMEAVTLTGERVGLMTEVITCMKLIKMNAWEPCFMARISSRCFLAL